jgi:predicted nucleic acid-binding protein
MLVDSSVWINHFRGRTTPSVATLRQWLELRGDAVLVADLVLLEVLRGVRNAKEEKLINQLMSELEVVEIGGEALCRDAAKLYARLRSKGVTVAKTIDLLIATWCIRERVPLLHDDADFKAFTPLGLRVI